MNENYISYLNKYEFMYLVFYVNSENLNKCIPLLNKDNTKKMCVVYYYILTGHSPQLAIYTI